MAITITNNYETTQAYTEMTLSDGKYRIDYMATGEVNKAPNNVQAYIGKVDGESVIRIGYATYDNAVVSIRFDYTEYVTTVSNQATISTQIFNDLQSFLA